MFKEQGKVLQESESHLAQRLVSMASLEGVQSALFGRPEKAEDRSAEIEETKITRNVSVYGQDIISEAVKTRQRPTLSTRRSAR